MKTIETKFLFMILICYLMTGCANKTDTNTEDTNYGNVSNKDSVNSTGSQTQDSTNGKIKQQNQGHENSTAAVNNNRGEGSGNIKQPETNPQKNPDAMQKANAAVSGVGESGHAPANKAAAPANDPNNKVKIDTTRYK